MLISTVVSVLLHAVLLARPTTASYAFYVGSDLTASGDILVGGTGEEVSSHWLSIFPAREHLPNSTITVGVTHEAVLPGHLISIPQAAFTHRYISMEYSDYWGLPAPLTNGGLNSQGVAVRDVWAPNRRELIEITPNPQTGINYANLARIVLERASSARQGVQIIGDLIAEHGYATYGGNTHLIADKHEAWVVWEFAGGVRLWAAERLRQDEVRVLYPGYIHSFPVDFADSEDYMGAPHLISFAEQRGWWSALSGEDFNILKVYGLAPTGNETSPVGGAVGRVSQAEMEAATRKLAPVTETDLMSLVRDPRMSTDEAGYGQVVRLPRAQTDPDLLRIWIAPTSSIAAPFIPWWLGVQSVPSEFGPHRYLTKGASSSFLHPDYVMQEASLFAGRVFKRVLYYMCALPHLLHPIVNELLISFELESFDHAGWVEHSAAALLERGADEGRELVRNLLTHYSHSRAGKAVELGKLVGDALDAYVKITGRWKHPTGTEINMPADGEGGVNCLLPDGQEKDVAMEDLKKAESQSPLARTADAIAKLFRTD